LTVSGAKFDFAAAARGTSRSHDLVVVATDETPPKRLLRLVAGLARSLDLAASRRPVSLVLIGQVGPADRAEIERYVRLLHVRTHDAKPPEIERTLSVLLPLRLPKADLMHGLDPVNEVLGALGPRRTTSQHIALVQAATQGPEMVREALRRYLNQGSGWQDESEEDDD